MEVVAAEATKKRETKRSKSLFAAKSREIIPGFFNLVYSVDKFVISHINAVDTTADHDKGIKNVNRREHEKPGAQR